MTPRLPYFNFYPSDFMRGVRGLTPQEVGIYAMLLCRIYEENGPIDLHEGRLAAYCGCTEKVVAKAIERLVYLGRIKLVGRQIVDERAEEEILKRENALKSQSRAGKASAEKRKENQRPEATDVQQPLNHLDRDKDISNSVAKATDANASDVRADQDRCVRHFNETATRVGWPQVQVVSQARRAALAQRIASVGGADQWCEAINRAALSPLLTGQTGKGWRADFDWLSKAANFTKLIEGNYDDRKSPAPYHHDAGRAAAPSRDSFLDEIAFAARSRPPQGRLGH